MDTEKNKDFALRLFLSADLIGSTALKSQPFKAHEPPWLNTFTSFYEEFPSIFKDTQSDFNCPEILFWKGAGDELLWVATLAKSEQSVQILLAFKRALERYNDLLGNKKIGLKGSAWIAGFPIMNKVIGLPLPLGNNLKDDYVGPSIDIGFRLSKFATRMKMVISVDLAWLILIAPSRREYIDSLPLRFDSSQPMKGVLGGKNYPIIWIECKSPLEQAEYALRHRSGHDMEWTKNLRKFCSDFIEDTDGKIILPYILGDPEIGNPHKSYNEWRLANDTPSINQEPFSSDIDVTNKSILMPPAT